LSGRSLREALERLLWKYRSLAALRLRREEAERGGLREFGRDEVALRTEELRRIAGEFPGSLREVDVSPASILHAKALAIEAEIEALRSDPLRDRPLRFWVAVVLDYHATLREALAVKAWLSARLPKGAQVTPVLAAEFHEWHTRYPHRHGVVAPEGSDFLERHRRPPGGRIHSLIWRALSDRHHAERRVLERAVFGPIDDGEPDTLE
jgi:hypothetical protein